MTPFVLGLNHETAPLAVRERLAVSPGCMDEFLHTLKSAGELDEVVALSTCNRTEIYGHSADQNAARRRVTEALARHAQNTALPQALYFREQADCVRHLFRVASGLDSMVRGENEILGQVKQAYHAAQQGGFTGKWLNILFQRSLYVGKRVRTETGISLGAGSIGSVAVSVAERIFGNLSERTVMILGAGKMAELTAKHLLSQKVRSLIVANRTFDSACELAKRFGGTAMHFDEGLRQMAHADIVICSTAAPHPVVRTDHVRRLMEERRGRSLFFIDIAVPRDVEPDVNRLDNVYLFNLDDLQTIVAENQTRRHSEILRAEELVESESLAFAQWVKEQQAGQRTGLKHSA